MRERDIEQYLDEQVTRAGGTTRKFVSPGHRGVPDRIVVWPEYGMTNGVRTAAYTARVHFVETKAPGKKPRPEQRREHERLRKLGCTVLVLATYGQINLYVRKQRACALAS